MSAKNSTGFPAGLVKAAIFVAIFSCPLRALGAPPQAFDDILQKMANQQAAMSSIRFSMTEHITHALDPDANVTKTYACEEQGACFRVDADFPGLERPPKMKNMMAGSTYPYVNTRTAYDGQTVTQHVPSSYLGIVDRQLNPGRPDQDPITSMRPVGPYSRLTLREYLAQKALRKGAEVNVDPGSGSVPAKIDIKAGRERIVATLDPNKDYSILELQMYWDDQPTDHRVFSGYEQKSGVWLAREIRTDLYHSQTHQVTTTHVASIADGWEVNVPIPPERFRVVFPEGTRVFDGIAGHTYTIETKHELDEGVAGINAAASLPAAPASAAAAEKLKLEQEAQEKLQADAATAAADAEIKAPFTAGIYDVFVLGWKPAGILLLILLAGVGAYLAARKGFVPRVSRSRSSQVAFVTIWGAIVALATANVFVAFKTGRMGPAIDVDSYSINAGTVVADYPAKVNAAVRNVGTRDLVIYRKKRSCALCDNMIQTRLVLAPGEARNIDIDFFPSKWMTEKWKTSVTLATNDPQRRDVQIKVQGMAVPSIISTPNTINAGQVRVNTETRVAVTLSEPSGRPIALKRNGKIDNEVSVVSATPARDADGKNVLEVLVAIRPSKVGSWARSIELPVESPAESHAGFYIVGQVNDAPNVKPPIIAISMTPGDSRHEAKVELNGLGSDAAGLSVNVKPAILGAKLEPCAFEGGSSMLTVWTLPEAEAAQLPAHGEVVISAGGAGSQRVVKAIPFIIRNASVAKAR